MQSVPQIEPVTQLQRNYNVVMEQLINGPVFLSLKGKAAAVVVSIEQWQETADRLAFFERQAAADAAIAADDWVTGEELDAEFAKMGLA